MRAGDPPGCAHFAQLVAGLDHRARLHIDLVQVAVQRHETLSVVNENRLAIEKIIAGVDHHTRRRRNDRRARGGGDVHAGVRVARLIIEHASQTKRARARSLDR